MAWSESMYIIQQFYNAFDLDNKVSELDTKVDELDVKVAELDEKVEDRATQEQLAAVETRAMAAENGLPILATKNESGNPTGYDVSELTNGVLWFIKEE